MAKQVLLRIGTVVEIEDKFSHHKDIKSGEDISDNYNGLRIRVKLEGDDVKRKDGTLDYTRLPWCFPLLPKTFQSIPKTGETAIVLVTDLMAPGESQRFYVGPLISQPQYNDYCPSRESTSLLKKSETTPLRSINRCPDTNGAFPKSSDVAVVGRGSEDIILRNENATSEIDLRAGIRGEPINDQDPNLIGNIIFNGVDPAYIQLKHKNGIVSEPGVEANSVINIVANRINIMSNKDDNINCNLNNPNELVSEGELGNVMHNLQPIPLGVDLLELLNIMKHAILHHVHPWAGMEQCGDWGGWIDRLEHFNLNSILSKYVRIS